MKNLLLLALLAVSAPALAQSPATVNIPEAGTIGALDTKNGFRQYRLGAPITEMSGLKARGKDMYVAPGESMTVGNAKLSMLVFFATKGKLSTIALSATEKINCDNLLAALVAQYGAGTDAGHNKLIWTGQVATMVYELKSRYSSYGSAYTQPRTVEYCEVYISSNAIAAELAEEKDAAAKKAASDL